MHVPDKQLLCVAKRQAIKQEKTAKTHFLKILSGIYKSQV